jgi:hypothetical protein
MSHTRAPLRVCALVLLFGIVASWALAGAVVWLVGLALTIVF